MPLPLGMQDVHLCIYDVHLACMTCSFACEMCSFPMYDVHLCDFIAQAAETLGGITSIVLAKGRIGIQKNGHSLEKTVLAQGTIRNLDVPCFFPNYLGQFLGVSPCPIDRWSNLFYHIYTLLSVLFRSARLPSFKNILAGDGAWRRLRSNQLFLSSDLGETIVEPVDKVF